MLIWRSRWLVPEVKLDPQTQVHPLTAQVGAALTRATPVGVPEAECKLVRASVSTVRETHPGTWSPNSRLSLPIELSAATTFPSGAVRFVPGRVLTAVLISTSKEDLWLWCTFSCLLPYRSLSLSQRERSRAVEKQTAQIPSSVVRTIRDLTSSCGAGNHLRCHQCTRLL